MAPKKVARVEKPKGTEEEDHSQDGADDMESDGADGIAECCEWHAMKSKYGPDSDDTSKPKKIARPVTTKQQEEAASRVLTLLSGQHLHSNDDSECSAPVEFVTEAAAFMTTSESTPANDSNASDSDLPETQPRPPLSQESSDADSAETQILGRPVDRPRPRWPIDSLTKPVA